MGPKKIPRQIFHVNEIWKVMKLFILQSLPLARQLTSLPGFILSICEKMIEEK